MSAEVIDFVTGEKVEIGKDVPGCAICLRCNRDEFFVALDPQKVDDAGQMNLDGSQVVGIECATCGHRIFWGA